MNCRRRCKRIIVPPWSSWHHPCQDNWIRQFRIGQFCRQLPPAILFPIFLPKSPPKLFYDQVFLVFESFQWTFNFSPKIKYPSILFLWYFPWLLSFLRWFLRHRLSFANDRGFDPPQEIWESMVGGTGGSKISSYTCCAWAGGTFFHCLRKVPPAHLRSVCVVQELGW